jgi:hypothetical protein
VAAAAAALASAAATRFPFCSSTGPYTKTYHVALPYALCNIS